MPVENIVAEDKACRPAVKELFSDKKCLSKALGFRLNGVLQIDAPFVSVTDDLTGLLAEEDEESDSEC